jgi:small subunit ribosomal protein S8
MDNLANTLVNIKNCENAAKRICTTKPSSKLISGILKIMQKNEYIKAVEYVDDGKAGQYKIELQGHINNCKAIKPRYAVKRNQFTKWEKRYLPAKEFGLLIVSTSQGIMTHKDAENKGIGGKLLAFVY